jgi:DNA-directed RNA polymerase subunit M/transcription elongation factor TFIIS
MKFCKNCDNLLIPINGKLFCKICNEEMQNNQGLEEYKIIKVIPHENDYGDPILHEAPKTAKISNQEKSI